MHHFVTEMCTCVHIYATEWCIEGYLSDALWDLWDGSIDTDRLVLRCVKVWQSWAWFHQHETKGVQQLPATTKGSCDTWHQTLVHFSWWHCVFSFELESGDKVRILQLCHKPLDCQTAMNIPPDLDCLVNITVGQRKKVSNCSYLLPRAAAAGSNGTNKGQTHKVPVDEIARVLVYRMDVTRSQLSANTGIPVCLVRKIWQFKVFTGKEVTPLHEEGNFLQFRAGKKATHFHYKWFIDIWQTDKTERKERSQCELVDWKYVSRCDEQMKTTCRIRSRGDVGNTIGTEWRRLKHI